MERKLLNIEIIEQSHVFQPGCFLSVQEAPQAGYSIPDVGDGSPGTIPAEYVIVRSNDKDNVDEFYGKCLLTKVSNFYKDHKKNESEGIANIGIVESDKVRVIHYPDCQQIIFHMPQYAYEAGTFRITELAAGEVIEECAVRDKLNGGTMIVLDSLPLKPGFYCMEADWPGGWTHEIRFIKFKEGFPNAAFQNAPDNVLRALKNDEQHLLKWPVVLEDDRIELARLLEERSIKNNAASADKPQSPQTPGFYVQTHVDSTEKMYGADLGKLKEQMLTKFGWVLEYEQEGRGGTVTYREGDVTIKFDWEFAGGRALVLIFIPEEKYWEAHTNTPLSRRLEILHRVARQVIEDQAPGRRFEIDYNTLIII